MVVVEVVLFCRENPVAKNSDRRTTQNFIANKMRIKVNMNVQVAQKWHNMSIIKVAEKVTQQINKMIKIRNE